MPLPNLNKLFPRLTIRTKLTVAFVVVAALPLAAVAAVTVVTTIGQLRAVAEASVLHDLESVVRDTKRALEYLERDVEYLGTELMDDDPAGVSRFLARSPALFRLRVVGPDGVVIRSIAPGSRQAEPGDDAAALYYVHRARGLQRGEGLALPVEVRSPFDGLAAPVSAVAVLIPVLGSGGLEAVIVGEAFADELFAELSTGAALVPGTTMLVDTTGIVLFRSDRSAAWERAFATELADAGVTELRSQDPDSVRPGLRWSGAYLLGQVTLRLGSSLAAPRLNLVRAVSATAINRPAREFLIGVGASGVAILAVVLGLAYLAAREFTKPIYRLSAAVRELAAGGPPQPVVVDSNDELEDLASDFHDMATALDQHRQGLEQLVDEATRAMQQTHAELLNVVAHAADGIVVLGPDGRIRLWNRGAEQLFGWSAEEAVDRAGETLLRPEGVSLEEEAAFIARELGRRGAVVNLLTQRRHRSGEIMQVSLTQSLIRDEDGHGDGQVLILRDASLQARLEAQMRRSERLAAVSVMAAGLAHELNNPLAILGNRLEVMQDELEDEPDPVRLRHDLQVMRDHVSRLSALTRDLLQFAREDHDPVQVVPVEGMVRYITGLLEPSLLSRGVTIELGLDPTLPPLSVRPHAAQTVVLNLVLNAADAMASGGRVTIEARSSTRPDWVEIAVIDDGPGVPPDLHGRVFEPFFTTKMAGKGTGLGLAVCRSIVESHGGELNVSTHPGRGARFVLTLPVATDAAP